MVNVNRLVYCAVPFILGCFLGLGVLSQYYQDRRLEDEVGTNAIASLNDLATIALIDEKQLERAKRRVEFLLVQDIHLYEQHMLDTGEIGRLSRETLKRITGWREKNVEVKSTSRWYSRQFVQDQQPPVVQVMAGLELPGIP